MITYIKKKSMALKKLSVLDSDLRNESRGHSADAS